MEYPEQYRTELLNALNSIDLNAVDEVLEIFREARVHGRCIFVCDSGSNAHVASRLLCDMVRASSINRAKRFRILALGDDLPQASARVDDLLNDRVLVDQLRNLASAHDVVLGISPSGNPASLVRALEYAKEIGCRTVSICGRAGKLAKVSDTTVLVPASHLGNVEDAQIIVCRMIGHYFTNFDKD